MATVKAEHLTKKYASRTALNDVSFTVEAGCAVGLLGENGAGKSTVMNIITGYIEADGGAVTVDGVDIRDGGGKIRGRIGYMPEGAPLYDGMTVGEYLNFVYDIKGAKQNRRAHLAEICSLLKLNGSEGRLIKNLSHGYRQRVGLAQALVGDPDILILDEPTSGLDPARIIEFRELIKKLAVRRTVLFSSHILSEVQAVCGRIMIIKGGRLLADGTPEELEAAYSTDGEYIVRCDIGAAQAKRLFGGIAGVNRVRRTGEGRFTVRFDNGGADGGAAIFKAAAESGVILRELSRTRGSLEKIFIELSGEEERR